MRARRFLLWTALAAGIVAVIAGLTGLRWLAGGAATILLVAFILSPWARDDVFDATSHEHRRSDGSDPSRR